MHYFLHPENRLHVLQFFKYQTCHVFSGPENTLLFKSAICSPSDGEDSACFNFYLFSLVYQTCYIFSIQRIDCMFYCLYNNKHAIFSLDQRICPFFCIKCKERLFSLYVQRKQCMFLFSLPVLNFHRVIGACKLMILDLF